MSSSVAPASTPMRGGLLRKHSSFMKRVKEAREAEDATTGRVLTERDTAFLASQRREQEEEDQRREDARRARSGAGAGAAGGGGRGGAKEGAGKGVGGSRGAVTKASAATVKAMAEKKKVAAEKRKRKKFRGDPEETRKKVEQMARGELDKVDAEKAGMLALALGGGGDGSKMDADDQDIAMLAYTGDEDPPAGSVAHRILTERREAMKRHFLIADVLPVHAVVEHALAIKLRGGHKLGVFDCDWEEGGKHIASCSFDGSVVAWNLNDVRVRRRYEGHTGPVMCVKFVPTRGNELLISASMDKTVKLWDKRKGELMFDFTGHYTVPILSAAWFADGERVVVGGAGGNITVYDCTSAILLRHDPSATLEDVTDLRITCAPHNPKGHLGAVRAIATAADGLTFYTGGDDTIIRQWRYALKDKRVSLRREIKGHEGPVLDIRISPDGTKFASSSQDGSVRIWNVRGGVPHSTLRGHSGSVYCCCWSPEEGGRRLLSGGHDRCVCIWDVATGTILQHLKNLHRSYVLGLTFRFDGSMFATASGDRTVGVWRGQHPTIAQRIDAKASQCWGWTSDLISDLATAAYD